MRVQQLGSIRTRRETINLDSGSSTEREFTVDQVFERGEVTKNPKGPDGYRSPSSYFGRIVAKTASSGFPIGGATASFDAVRARPNGRNPKHIFGTIPVSAASPLTHLGFNERETLRMRIRNNVRDELVDVAMVLAEIGKTAETGANILYRIGRSMDAIYNRRPESYFKLMHGRNPTHNGQPLRGRRLDTFNRETAGLYLEWKYGIMPSVYDMYGISKALDANEDGSLWSNPPLLVARSSVGSAETNEVRFSNVNTGVGTIEATITVRDTRFINGRLDFAVDNELIRGISRYGFGLTTLATVAWDRQPFSFVVDMALPIAGLIKAWSGLAGVTPRGYTETSYVKRQALSVSGAIKHQTEVPDIQLNLESDGEVFDFNRSAFRTVPMPLPHLRNPVKVGNIATVLSLFTQLRKKREV